MDGFLLVYLSGKCDGHFNSKIVWCFVVGIMKLFYLRKNDVGLINKKNNVITRNVYIIDNIELFYLLFGLAQIA